jgi:hypothetical protein
MGARSTPEAETGAVPEGAEARQRKMTLPSASETNQWLEIAVCSTLIFRFANSARLTPVA